MIGLLVSIALMVTFIVGYRTAAGNKSLPDQRLPLSVASCSNETTSNSTIWTNGSNWKDRDDSALIQLLSVSYMWHQPIGTILSVILGLAFSVGFNFIDGIQKVNPLHISPPILRLWKRLCPVQSKEWLLEARQKNIHDATVKEFLKPDDNLLKDSRL